VTISRQRVERRIFDMNVSAATRARKDWATALRTNYNGNCDRAKSAVADNIFIIEDTAQDFAVFCIFVNLIIRAGSAG